MIEFPEAEIPRPTVPTVTLVPATVQVAPASVDFHTSPVEASAYATVALAIVTPTRPSTELGTEPPGTTTQVSPSSVERTIVPRAPTAMTVEPRESIAVSWRVVPELR